MQSQLDEDDILKEPILRFPNIDRSFQPWQNTKQSFNDKYDIQFGFDYNILSQSASDSVTGEDRATLGILRHYGVWDLTRKNDKDWGRLTWKVDHRHKLGSDIAPAELAGQVGYVGVTGTLFSDTGLVLVDLNWQQSFNDGDTGLIAGRFDPSDYMGVLGYANPWTAFSNLAVLLNPSIAFPDASLGIGAGHRFTDQWYVKGSINDANGLVTDELQAFEDGSEFFTWGEVGWTPSPDQQYLTNVHMVVWHVDDRKNAGIPSAQGYMVGANKTTSDQRWMGFMRAGWSSGASAIYGETYTLGFMRKFRRNSDLLGLAVNWGDPPDSSLRSQVTGELFYRVQLAQNLAITPSLQLLKDPALNPDDDTVWIWGIRVRMTL